MRGQHSTHASLGRRLRDRLPPFRGWAAAGWSLIVVAVWKLLGEVVANILADVVKASGWGWAQVAMDTVSSWLWAAWNSPATSLVAIVVGFVVLWFAPRRSASPSAAPTGTPSHPPAAPPRSEGLPSPTATRPPAVPRQTLPAPGNADVTPDLLADLYDGRHTMAQADARAATYLGTSIEVEGALSQVFALGPAGTLAILDGRPSGVGTGRVVSVSLTFHAAQAERVNPLDRGTTVRVRGQITGIKLTAVTLDNCELLDPP